MALLKYLLTKLLTEPTCFIHEATFDDEPGMRREAEQRKHSTVAEALEVARPDGLTLTLSLARTPTRTPTPTPTPTLTLTPSP